MFGRQVSDAFKRVLDSRRFAHGSCCHVLLHIKDVEAGMVSAREVKPCLLLAASPCWPEMPEVLKTSADLRESGQQAKHGLT